MNFTFTAGEVLNHVDDLTVEYTKVKFSDAVNNELSVADIVELVNDDKKNWQIFAYCYKDGSEIKKFAVFELLSLKKQGRTNYQMTVKRVDKKSGDEFDDNNEICFEMGNCACTIEDYVWDIPSGDSVYSTNDLSAKALVYAQKHQPRRFVDVIKTTDIITDSETTEQNKKHYFELQHTPIKDDLAYLEINGINYYEASDDIEIDRENKRIYFDTQEDDFSFENLQDSAETVRVFYKYIPE